MKTAIIIGVGRGLGFALAEQFGLAGMHVALLARSEKNLSEFEKKLRARKISCSSHPVDASDFTAMRQTLSAIARKNSVEVVIYNAVSRIMIPPLELDIENMVKAYRLDVAGALHAVQLILPFMQENESGTFLFTGGGAALKPWTAAPTISIAKAGIRSLAFMLAEELADSPIKMGTVTIMGSIKAGTAFDPTLIAEQYLSFYRAGVPGVELTYQG